MESLKEMRLVDVRTVDRGKLTDITKLQPVREDRDDCAGDRVEEFIRRAGNPYCFRVGEIVVKSVFAGEASLDRRMEEISESVAQCKGV